MARILLMSSREKGHVNPLVGVAQHLLRAGHTVGWLCLPSPSEQVRALGVETLALPGSGEAEDFVTGGPELAALVRDADRLGQWIRALLIDAVPALIDPTRELLAKWRADALVVDPMMYHGLIAAHQLGIPYACLSSSLNPVVPPEVTCTLTRHVDALSEARQALFAAHGMSPILRVCDALSPHMNGVFTTRAYVGDVALPPQTWLLGPSIPPGERGDEVDFPWDALDGRPLVYASFGSQISHQPRIFSLLAAATEPMGVQLVISCGALASSSWARALPAHVLPVAYAPQLKILQRARAFITHGGANSAMEALWAGVPILISPVCNDQPLQAHFVARRGTGLVLDLSQADPDAIQGALAQLLDEAGAPARAAREVQASYRSQDGAREAATRIHAMIR